MRRRALLTIFVVLLLIGAYGAYVVSYPKYPEVDGCVNPFAVVKPMSKVQENWSKGHIFFKLATKKEFWKLAKPWDVDYSQVKIAKHSLEYNNERIVMLAMSIPLKDNKHIIALYEFSKPVEGIKTRMYLFSVNETYIETKALSTNGHVTMLNSCPHECTDSADCGILERCNTICCKRSPPNPDCVFWCCDLCSVACLGGPIPCLTCALALCPGCYYDLCRDCIEEGSRCEPVNIGP